MFRPPKKRKVCPVNGLRTGGLKNQGIMERLCLTLALDGAYSTITKIRIRRAIRNNIPTHLGSEVRDDAMLVFRIVMLEGV